MPTRILPDVARFEFLPVPFIVTFWRMSKTDRVIHECPLITAAPGRLYDAWVVDGLHSWALGPLGGLIASMFQFILKTKILTPVSMYMESEDLDRLALLHIKALMQVHYRKVKRDPNHKRTHTEVCSKALCHKLEASSNDFEQLYVFVQGLSRRMASGLESNEGDAGTNRQTKTS